MVTYLVPIFFLIFIAMIIWNIQLDKKGSKNKLPLSPIDKNYKNSIEELFDKIFKKFK